MKTVFTRDPRGSEGRPPPPPPPPRGGGPFLRTSPCHFHSTALRPCGAWPIPDLLSLGASLLLSLQRCSTLGFLSPEPGILGLSWEVAWTSLEARLVCRANKN